MGHLRRRVAYPRGLLGFRHIYIRYRGWLSPSYAGSVLSTNCGTGGVFRPNLTGASVTAGGGTRISGSIRRHTRCLRAPQHHQSYPCGVFGNAPRNSIEGPGTVRTIWRFQRPSAWAKRAAWKCAPPSTTSSTPCNMQAWARRSTRPISDRSLGGRDAVVPIFGEIQVLKAASRRSASQRVGYSAKGLTVMASWCNELVRTLALLALVTPGYCSPLLRKTATRFPTRRRADLCSRSTPNLCSPT